MYEHTHRNVWEHYGAEKPDYPVFAHNMGLLVKATGLSVDAYYRKYGHAMSYHVPLTVNEAEEIQKKKYHAEIERERKDIERIARHVETMKLPEWKEEVEASAGKGKIGVMSLPLLVLGLIAAAWFLLMGRR